MLSLFFAALAGLISPFTTIPASPASVSPIVWRDAYPAAVIPAPAVQPLVARRLTAPRAATSTVPFVPFYSQFADITSPKWQKVGCGITDLTMLIHYYRPSTSVSVNQMLAKGIAQGAYDSIDGWTYQGLIDLGKPYGLTGSWYALPAASDAALARLKELLAKGPVIMSVHYKFDPASTIPHLVVVNGIDGDTVYVNDPATTKGTEALPMKKFLAGWKRKAVVIRPA